MSCGLTHQLIAGVAIGSACLVMEADRPEKTLKPFVGAVLSASLTKLPDVLEPAIHPNHRQFFHSVAFAGLLGLVAHKIYRWEPKNKDDETVRFVLLVGAAAYAIHLLLDASTPKCLPLFGTF